MRRTESRKISKKKDNASDLLSCEKRYLLSCEKRYIPYSQKRDCCLNNETVNTLFLYGENPVMKSKIIIEEIKRITVEYPQDDIYVFRNEDNDSYSFLQSAYYKDNKNIHVYLTSALTDIDLQKQLFDIEESNPKWIYLDFKFTDVLLPEIKKVILSIYSLSVPTHSIVTLMSNCYVNLSDLFYSMINYIRYLYYVDIEGYDISRLSDFSTPAFYHLDPYECSVFNKKDKKNKNINAICRQKIIHPVYKEIYTKIDVYSNV